MSDEKRWTPNDWQPNKRDELCVICLQDFGRRGQSPMRRLDENRCVHQSCLTVAARHRLEAVMNAQR